VHASSSDPANPELFLIKNTASTPYANIHGSSVEGCFLGPFSTADLTRLYGCILGTYSYIQAGEMWKQQVGNGQLWIKNGDVFEFAYRLAPGVLDRYINFKIGRQPTGIFIDFIRSYKEEFQRIFDSVNLKPPAMVPKSASLSRYAVVRPKTHIGDNVLVAQRAYLENSFLGDGANAQENCYIINSRLEGNNVTAHGAKIVHSRLAKNVFVGFNSFLRGTADCRLDIGRGSIVMPHTVIDLRKPVSIPPGHLVWGYIQKPDDLKYHSLSLKKLAAVRRQLKIKNMKFSGNGGAFVKAFRHRIQHILESNGAYFDGKKNRGHAQREQNISFNIIQPYTIGPKRGLFPTLDIQP
jgi:carbonic anhydrase/acetyltransferase-like protein (isoleucine patch superfamily)